ncbi:MAG: acyl-CoA dehydrogenase C-terminal domain-containing protein [Arenicellales bacterium]|jgi:alkylation response protein AidB-like acyl-CoA dehydrogenase|nr:acyl-CoA dehydrogenase C-terminal domain-containing protein [Arenicellales bacterium]MDP6313891.1 acyl-CoA dehydrogenase C-terminal domain-containing protein [Arenicellales bacterium]MDP7119861.1 acyl-CoA dehydrogenase C-terminal domain-containing protein [Arenicellales bacterium]MDP7192739.1 acyl-CoA dehydrogenase C-terminal domain-containing protein [Arenicellales bacterium]MDP7489473.1 acyl-CoA dehydrogenase C-terminal domain-containing protein [Arenicellales bacterium]
MPSYTAPLRDMRFVYHELFDAGDITALPGCEDATADLVDPVLDEAARLAENELFPLNHSGDRDGCRYQDGAVTTPAGFKAAYEQYAQGGWIGLACDPQYGGQGMPATLNVLLEEMACSANVSFATYIGLTRGAYRAIRAFASEALKDRYLPKMVSGEWSGTMCLTEPQCGTDLGLIRTRAEPAENDSYRISGTKIFITAGEHDLTTNIIHLVLARLPGAPAGIKGISLFLVPKFLPTEDGEAGERNAVTCAGIEDKMGIKASATCVINLDGAMGWLVGEPHKGMRAMFTMMNEARLGVGIQGLGLGVSAYQAAVDYARERQQGRALGGTQYPEQPADPIMVHPDIRRMLLTMRAFTEGARALTTWVARQIDVRDHSEDPQARKEADDLVQLLTPLVKSYLSEVGHDAAQMAVQVYGGHGYIRDNGVEQYARDARIAMIYEGANGIQALDLVGRKLPAHTGRYLRRFFHPVQAWIDANTADQALQPFVLPLAKAFGRLQLATGQVAQAGLKDPNEAGAASSEYLKLFALVALAFLWARMAKIALAKREGDDSGFYDAKLMTARFFVERVLPQSGSLFATIMAGGNTMMSFPDEAF